MSDLLQHQKHSIHEDTSDKMNLFKELQNLMIKYHFRPSKKLSQYFCINEALLNFLIIKSELNENDTVLEVGPGTGFLTKKLLDKCKVVAVEKDEKLSEVLKGEFEKEISSGKLKVINNDVLKEDFDSLGITKVVSLPPYNISSDLIGKIVLSNIKKALVVLDEGFVEKLIAFEGYKEYNALTVISNLNAKVDVLEKIEKDSFFPKPNCLSVVIEMNFDRVESSKNFFIFIKELFRHKNKNLNRALLQSLPFLKKNLGWNEEVKNKFANLKNTSKKVYALTPKEIAEAYTKLTN